MVNKRPSSWSLQNIVEEILQPSIEGVSLRWFLAGDAGALLAQDAASFGRLGAGYEESPVSV